VGTHLHQQQGDSELRRRQARVVAGEAARHLERDLQVVVLGDMNAEPGTPELEPLEELLDHAVPQGRSTAPSSRPRWQLDHVLVSEDLEVLEAGVVTTRVSDHLPVTAAVRPRPRPPTADP
jgi:endonuclease/exonuclease/phosphatase family metal-dependent hydrolase